MESAQLMALSKMPGITLYGVDYEERQPGAGRAFLDEQGNPFSRIVADTHGATGINWGVYGVPETYVVDGKGVVRFKLVGQLTAAAMTEPASARDRKGHGKRLKHFANPDFLGCGMQISAQTLLASQQAAQIQPQPRPRPAFAAALEKTEVAPLPLKQTAPVHRIASAAAQPARQARHGWAP